MTEGRNLLFREVLVFVAMVTVESIVVGGNTLFKAATSGGLSYYVFTAYACLIGALLLLPFSFFVHRKRGLPPLKFSVLSKIFMLALIGFFSQILGYKGMDYSDPTLSSVISNLTPAFTFILAVIFRMEKLNVRSSRTHAKILGTIISISGAFVVTFYVGPTILSIPSSSAPRLSLLRSSSQSEWITGGLFLAASFLMIAIMYVLQANILAEYPVELIVVLLTDSFLCIISVVSGFVIERNLELWKVKPDIVLVATVYMGFCGPFLANFIYAWSMRMKGPVYVAMFKPLSIVIAIVMGFVFLGDALHLGSVIGAAIISVGFYAVLRGEAKENKDVDNGLSPENVPFLGNSNTETV